MFGRPKGNTLASISSLSHGHTMWHPWFHSKKNINKPDWSNKELQDKLKEGLRLRLKSGTMQDTDTIMVEFKKDGVAVKCSDALETSGDGKDSESQPVLYEMTIGIEFG